MMGTQVAVMGNAATSGILVGRFVSLGKIFEDDINIEYCLVPANQPWLCLHFAQQLTSK